MTSKASLLAGYVDAVVEDFATELDPDEKLWPSYASLSDLRLDLWEYIEARVGDWEREQGEKYQAAREPPEPDPGPVYKVEETT